MIISHATDADLEAICGLEEAGFAPFERWSKQSWVEELAGDRWVITRLDVHATVIAVASFGVSGDLADLYRVVVHPDSRGQGIGASLVRAGLDWAAAVGARRMLLEVRPDNDSAVGLYRRLGFEEVSVRRDYYGPGHDALVMQHSIVGEDQWRVESA
jgi:[ribosomal protein S18]-alanine N-acetyltransferase